MDGGAIQYSTGTVLGRRMSWTALARVVGAAFILVFW